MTASNPPRERAGQAWHDPRRRHADGEVVPELVEPGEIELRFGASSTDIRLTAAITLTGPTLVLDHTRDRHCHVNVSEEHHSG